MSATASASAGPPLSIPIFWLFLTSQKASSSCMRALSSLSFRFNARSTNASSACSIVLSLTRLATYYYFLLSFLPSKDRSSLFASFQYCGEYASSYV